MGLIIKKRPRWRWALKTGMRLIFVVDTLEYLHRGGRIGGAQRLVGSMLSIKPVLHLVDGRIEPLASVRTKRKAVSYMLQTMEEEMQGKANVRVTVMNALAQEEGDKIAVEVQRRLQPIELFNTDISPVIGTHVGPGTVGVIYYAEP